MVLYEVILVTQAGEASSKLFKPLMTKLCQNLWRTGAQVADLQAWGQRDLAYRIRKQGVNHYHAQYYSLLVHCSPKALLEVKEELNNSDLVLRHMALKKSYKPEVSKAKIAKFREPPPTDLDLIPDEIESLKYEYRNLVMQRIFEGRSARDLLSEQLSRHRLVSTHRLKNMEQVLFEIDRLKDAGVTLSTFKEKESRLRARPSAVTAAVIADAAAAAARDALPTPEQ
uniref:Ribosomal protein S6 n=1 Tax=Chrysotila carterae TaxID=13221 RepID=A0A7S4BDF4_CHRCT|mmetsp:Transcript_4263/g.9284  ORF Transcript_4263/g.9284 Transcript_4263/m.9284 type:complete len:227 (+) Transcript_4263:150-830(+)